MYVGVTKDEVQRSRWTFYEVVKLSVSMFTVLEKFIKAIILPLIMWYMTFGTALLRHFFVAERHSLNSLNPLHPEFPGLEAWARSLGPDFPAACVIIIAGTPVIPVPGLPVIVAGLAAVTVRVPAI